MLSKKIMAVCSAGVVLGTPSLALADTVLEKVAQTGVLTAGVSFQSVPYSYVDDEGNLVGYSIDLLKLIEDQVEAEINRDIVVQMVEATDPATRIPMLETGEIDISCDTRFTWERERHVDFSISYGLSDVSLLTLADSQFDASGTLANKKIGVFQNSFGEAVMAQVRPEAEQVVMTSIDSAFEALDSGVVDAISSDSIVLMGLAAQRGAPAYRIAPDSAFAQYGIACMVPEANSTFMDMVNYAIAGLAQGYVDDDPRYVNVVGHWFDEATGIVPLPNNLVKDFFESVLRQRTLVPPVPTEP